MYRLTPRNLVKSGRGVLIAARDFSIDPALAEAAKLEGSVNTLDFLLKTREAKLKEASPYKVMIKVNGCFSVYCQKKI